MPAWLPLDNYLDSECSTMPYDCYVRPTLLRSDLLLVELDVNPLECKGNYSATSNRPNRPDTKLVQWPWMGG